MTEQAVFEEMYARGDQDKIRKEGFSLLDMKRYLEARGFEANGYEAPLDKLVGAGIPAIVLINDNGYNHFVVIKGMRGERVLIGDPSGGTRVADAREVRIGLGQPDPLRHHQPPGHRRLRPGVGLARRRAGTAQQRRQPGGTGQPAAAEVRPVGLLRRDPDVKPTPRKLALVMSIAGLGASLGGGAHARSDGDAARLVGLAATVGLPLPASADDFPASVRVRVEGFPLALVAQPLDRILAAADENDTAAPRRPPCAGMARGQLAPATARPRSLWGARRAAASVALAPPVVSGASPTAAGLHVPDQSAGTSASGCTATPTADAAATRPAADEPVVRRPKRGAAGRPAPVGGAQRAGVADAPAERASATDRALGILARHLAGITAGESAAPPAPAGSAQHADAPAGRASAADRALGELARHLTGIAAAAQGDIAPGGAPHTATAPVPGPSPALAGTPAGAGAATAQAVDLYLDIDPLTEPGAIAQAEVLPDASATAGAAQVDIALDLDFDLYLQSVGAAGSAAAAASDRSAAFGAAASGTTTSPAGRAADAPGAVLDLELDLDLDVPVAATASAPSAVAAVDAARHASTIVPAIDIDLAESLSPGPATGLDLNLDLPDLGLGPGLGLVCPAAAAVPVAAAAFPASASSPVPALAAAPPAPAPAVAPTSPDAASPPVNSPAAPPAPVQALGMPAAAPAGLPLATTLPQPAALGELLALGESRLDEVRGGFQTSDGLQLSLGIERAVYINGNLVTTPSLNVVGLGTTPGSPTAVNVPAAGAAGVTLVQQGAGNTFLPGPLLPAAGTVIQNTLDGQTIRSVTSVNATVNSLEVMRARSFESSMRGAIIDSLRR